MDFIPIAIQWFFTGLSLGLFAGGLFWMAFSRGHGRE